MENYTLQSNESVLYKGGCSLVNKSANVELVLTNLNLVFIKKTKKLFAKEEIEVEIYPVEEIKIYNGLPQIKQKDNIVEIFLTSGEIDVSFISKQEIRKFISKAYELLTGKTMAERVSDKVKGAVKLVDDTIGVNTADAIKNVVGNGLVGAVFGSFGKNARNQLKGGSPLKEVLSVTKDVFGKKTDEQETSKPMDSLDDQIETLKKLKDLLDYGIISQDEFDIKKKEIMSL